MYEGDSTLTSHIHNWFTCITYLYKYRYFHVCDGSLLPDVMHDLLEGALQYEVKLMLKCMIMEDQLFSLGT